jgi:hypothetical protein
MSAVGKDVLAGIPASRSLCTSAIDLPEAFDDNGRDDGVALLLDDG